MDDLLSEKEQIEQMRTWWSEYGNYVIAGVTLGAAILFGINYYQNSQRNAALEASALYDALTNHIVAARLEDAEAVAGQISADFADSAYAPQSKLAIARLYMDQNRDQDAADSLLGLIDGDADEGFRHVARVRLAKILLYQDKADEVVALVDGQESEAFAARYAEVLGDAYVKLGQFDDARVAFQRALGESNQAATIDQSFVQLKLLDLPLETFSDVPEIVEDALEDSLEETVDESVDESVEESLEDAATDEVAE